MKHEKFLELDQEGRIWWGATGNNMPAQKRFLTEVRQGIVPQTLWKYEEVGHTQDAKKELLKYVHFQNTDNVLDSVKPTRLLQRMLQIATEPKSNDIILDFFAGSASTAHAVLKQNHEDGGNRHYICVQFPEPLPEPEPTLETIADIGQERIRRVSDEFTQENATTLALHGRTAPEDLGVRVFKLAASHYRPWQGIANPTPEDYESQMTLFRDLLAGNWQPASVIWEVALKEGFGLNSRVEVMPDLACNAIHRVTDPDREQSFLICLDDRLQPETIGALGLTKDDLFVCRDMALTDELAANLALQCRLKTL